MTHYFISKETRNNIVDKLLYSLRLSKLDDQLICYILRVFHIIIPLLIIVLLFTNSFTLITISFLILVIADILFITFNGCILTILERKLSHEDYTLIDPILNILSINNSNTNRYDVTLFSGTLLSLLVVYNFYISLK